MAGMEEEGRGRSGFREVLSALSPIGCHDNSQLAYSGSRRSADGRTFLHRQPRSGSH